MTSSCIGVCKLDSSIGRCLTDHSGKGWLRRDDENREQALAFL